MRTPPGARALLLAGVLAAVLAAVPAAAPAQEAAQEAGAPGAPEPGEAGDAAAAPLAGDEVLLVAESVSRDEAAGLIVAEGAVEIRHRDLRLRADRVVYQEDAKQVVADGNVVFDAGDDRVQGEHLELNLETRVGFFTRAQGFVQTYYFTGERLDKLGPDRYFIRRGTFTTCEGELPDWSFHATSTTITIDEYLHAWNPSLFVKRLPLFYLPYAVFPIKRERSTGLLVPNVRYSKLDGFVVRNAFYWAPRDDFDATVGVDWFERSGWGLLGELRYLRAARTHGVVEAYAQRKTDTDAEQWVVSSRHSQQLPYGVQGEAELFVQSDRKFIATIGDTLEERSSQSSSSSFYLNRSFGSTDVSLAGRREDSLVTERRTTSTRFPEVTLERTSTRLFGSDLFLKLLASGVRLTREEESGRTETDRYHLAPEFSWPISLGGVASVIPGAGYAVTWYTEGLDGQAERREVPSYRVGLEGPRIYRIFPLAGDSVEKVKHLVEPRVTYHYTPEVDQESLPQFDSLDSIGKTNRLEYSLTNTVYARERPAAPRPAGRGGLPAPAAAGAGAGAWGGAGAGEATAGEATATAATGTPGADPSGAAGGEGGSPGSAGPSAAAADEPPRGGGTTRELLWVKLAQSYHFDEEDQPGGRAFSNVDWDARARPVRGLDLTWRGSYDVHGGGVRSQNVGLEWQFLESGNFRGDWRTSRDTGQEFLDLGVRLGDAPLRLEGRSRYNLAEDAFLENRASLTLVSQCWEITVGYVRWPNEYEYSLQISLKGIGTVLKL